MEHLSSPAVKPQPPSGTSAAAAMPTLPWCGWRWWASGRGWACPPTWQGARRRSGCPRAHWRGWLGGCALVRQRLGEGGGGLSWVWAAPLWGNPLVPRLPAPDLALLPGMSSVGGALQWWADVQPWLPGGSEAVASMAAFPIHSTCSPVYCPALGQHAGGWAGSSLSKSQLLPVALVAPVAAGGAAAGGVVAGGAAGTSAPQCVPPAFGQQCADRGVQ